MIYIVACLSPKKYTRPKMRLRQGSPGARWELTTLDPRQQAP